MFVCVEDDVCENGVCSVYVIMGRWYEFSVCIVCQVVRLYSVVEIVVMSGEVACCSVVCGTYEGTTTTLTTLLDG